MKKLKTYYFFSFVFSLFCAFVINNFINFRTGRFLHITLKVPLDLITASEQGPGNFDT
jgi:hypothetical protein